MGADVHLRRLDRGAVGAVRNSIAPVVKSSHLRQARLGVAHGEH